MWQRFTEPARRVILLAQQEATRTLSRDVDSEHLLLGLMVDEDTIPAKILAGARMTQELVQQQLSSTNTTAAEELRLSPPDIEELKNHFKVDAELVRRIEEQLLRKLRTQNNKPDLKLTTQAKQVLELAADEARRMHLSYIGPEHLLLGLLRQEDSATTISLKQAGLDLDRARELVLKHTKSCNDETA